MKGVGCIRGHRAVGGKGYGRVKAWGYEMGRWREWVRAGAVGGGGEGVGEGTEVWEGVGDREGGG